MTSSGSHAQRGPSCALKADFHMVGLLHLGDGEGFGKRNEMRQRWVDFIEKSFSK